MNPGESLKFYTPLEEKINIYSHVAGLILSVIALLMLLLRAFSYGDSIDRISAAVFGLSLVVLYLASTLYHSAKTPARRGRLRIIDHASIYILIAGTYTPFSLITLSGPIGWSIFYTVWAMAITGTVLKVFFTGRFNLVSTLMYIFMGWIIMFAIKPLVDGLSIEALFWLFSGGFWYTSGAVIYSIKRIKFNHALFHLFVLAGSISHFIAVYAYVLPGP